MPESIGMTNEAADREIVRLEAEVDRLRADSECLIRQLDRERAALSRARAELARERERGEKLGDKLVEAYSRGWEDKATGEPFCPRDATEDLLAAPERQEVGE